MKKYYIFFLAMLSFTLFGCSSTTITEREGNYRYTQGEKIEIIDIDTSDNLGNLITGSKVLLDSPFTISSETSNTEEENEDTLNEDLVDNSAIDNQHSEVHKFDTLKTLNIVLIVLFILAIFIIIFFLVCLIHLYRQQKRRGPPF